MIYKKAMSGFVVSLIIALAVILLIILVTYKEAQGIEKTGNLEACRLSVIAASEARFLGKPINEIDCPRRDLTITLKDIQVNGVASENSAEREVAEEMKTCWNKMSGDKQLNPFEQNFLFGSKSVCLLCASINFDKEVQEKFPKLANFNTLLDKEGYLDTFAKPLQIKKSLLPTVVQADKKSLVSQTSLDTNLVYYVVYFTFSKNWLFDQKNGLNQGLYKIYGETLSSLEYDPQNVKTSYSIMFLIPSNDIGSLQCDTLKG